MTPNFSQKDFTFENTEGLGKDGQFNKDALYTDIEKGFNSAKSALSHNNHHHVMEVLLYLLEQDLTCKSLIQDPQMKLDPSQMDRLIKLQTYCNSFRLKLHDVLTDYIIKNLSYAKQMCSGGDPNGGLELYKYLYNHSMTYLNGLKQFFGKQPQNPTTLEIEHDVLQVFYELRDSCLRVFQEILRSERNRILELG